MKTSYLKPEIYNKIYGIMQYKNVLALRVSLETGLRIDDVLKIKKSDLIGRTIRGVSEKSEKPFKKVISVDLSNRLKEISGKIYIFEHRFKTGEHRTRQAVWKDLKKASRILGLNGNIAPHSARKTYAVELFKDSGFDKVQKELQHDNSSTTMIYAFADLLDNNRTNVSDFDFELFAEMVADKVYQKIKSLLQ